MNECSDILISVRSEYVAKMLTGQKTVELRRRKIHVVPGTRVWIYSKAPHAAVRACAVVDQVVSAEPSLLWRRFRSCAGVSEQEFQDYFGKCHMGCAIILKDFIHLKTEMSLHTIRSKVSAFHPPQFYSKLKRADTTLKILQSGTRLDS